MLTMYQQAYNSFVARAADKGWDQEDILRRIRITAATIGKSGNPLDKLIYRAFVRAGLDMLHETP